MAQLSVELKGDQRLSYMTLGKGWGVAGGRRGKGDLDLGVSARAQASWSPRVAA